MNSLHYQSKNKKKKLNEIKVEYKINNIKSKYILKKIFYNLNEDKSLKTIKHNKNLQSRLNINFNEYKKYSNIEIELIPLKNEFGKFINIPNGEESYFHIYYNGNKKETKKTKRNYLDENDRVIIIKIIILYHVKKYDELFKECKCIGSIRFKTEFYTKDINSMKGMFYGCSSLIELELSNFITDNVTDMS